MTPRIHRLGLAAVVLAALPLAAAAEQVSIDQAGIDNLGVETAAPQPVASASGTAVRARVVIPPSNEYAVGPMMAGVVDRVYALAGQGIEKGALLAEVLSNEFIGLQREYVDAVVESGLAQSNLARDRQLVEEGIVSKRRLEETRAAANAARARRNAARELLLQAGLDVSAVEALAASQSFRRTLPLRAPIDGVVTEAAAVTGQKVDALEPLFRVADLSQLWLELQLPRELVARMEAGTPVLAASGGQVIGRVLSVGRVVDPDTQIALARAELTTNLEGLRPGQFMSVRVGETSGSGTRGLVSVPVSALIRSANAAYVFVRNADGFEVRPVEVVSAEDDSVCLAGGVDPGEKVAVRGVAALKALWLGGEGG